MLIGAIDVMLYPLTTLDSVQPKPEKSNSSTLLVEVTAKTEY
jgi:hypothetical protein